MRFPRQASAIAILLLTIALVLVESGTAAEGDKIADRLVNVSASGRIAVVPDIARISAGVAAFRPIGVRCLGRAVRLRAGRSAARGTAPHELPRPGRHLYASRSGAQPREWRLLSL